MNNLSANAMFHFTNKFENLTSILENKFYPRYCMEYFGDCVPENGVKEYAIPMVCFCDIPLSQISNHIKEYGGYAIGLTKEWAKNKGINPIMYTTSNSSVVKIMRKILEDIWEEHIQNDDINDIDRNILKYISYLKKYQGHKWDGSNFNGESVRFYDEREWRYIPDNAAIFDANCKIFMNKETYLNEEERNKKNDLLSSHIRLEFEPSDIKYIIVKDDAEVVKIQKVIESIFNDKTYAQVRILLSRILSIKQIVEDF